MTRDEADAIATYIERLEERVNFQSIQEEMKLDGFDDETMDRAMKALGALCGRTLGWG